MFLCCGEALIDMVPMQGAAGEQGFRPLPGGAIFNTAVSLGRLGQPVALLAGISTDLFGQMLTHTLRASAVQTDFLVSSPQPTCLAFLQLQDGQANYTFYAENCAGNSLTTTAMPAIDDAVTGLYFGGISLLMEPAAEAYVALAEQQAGSRLIVLDPNIRPSLMQDPMGYRQRLQRLLQVAHLVKVSDEDLAWLVPEVGNEQKAVQSLQGHDQQIIIVTQGAAGAVAYLPDGSQVTQAAVAAKVVDTVGAGDTFNAGVLASLMEQQLTTPAALVTANHTQWQQALKLGARVAAITVGRAGANPPWHSEL